MINQFQSARDERVREKEFKEKYDAHQWRLENNIDNRKVFISFLNSIIVTDYKIDNGIVVFKSNGSKINTDKIIALINRLSERFNLPRDEIESWINQFDCEELYSFKLS